MKRIVILYLMFMAANYTQAQMVTQAWAKLANNAFARAIAVDASGNVFTANVNNLTVSKITNSGSITQNWATLAHDDHFFITTDAVGSQYIANGFQNTITKISTSKDVTQNWAILATNASPRCIAIDASGNLYTANYGNNTVSKITSNGVVTQAWATLPTNSYSDAIIVDNAGNVFTANSGTNTISKITSSAVVIENWATLASNALPNAIAIDAFGNLYILNYNKTVSKITSSGVVIQNWAALATNADPAPFGMVIDGMGNLYVADYAGSYISKITSAGLVTQSWATLASGAKPNALVISNSGNLFTVNFGDNTVSKITSAAILPINLLSFTGTNNKSTNILTWNVTDAVNFGHFELQRQDDGAISFNTIQSIPYNNRQGNYAFTDTAVYNNEAYRLKMVNLDGSSTYSAIVYLKHQPKAFSIKSIYPLPAVNALNISLYAPKVTNVFYTVFDMQGRTVKTEQHSVNGTFIQELRIANLKRGDYIIKVQTGDGYSSSVKFVKL